MSAEEPRDPGHRRRYLRIHLNDHLAAAVGVTNVARRCRGSNEGTPLGAFLGELVEELQQDRAALEQVMAALGFGTDHLKLAAAVVGERLVRLKLNGRLVSYSDLSRVLELDGLHIGVEYKLQLWHRLKRLAAHDRRLAASDIDALIERAVSQLARLDAHRIAAAERAFVPQPAQP